MHTPTTPTANSFTQVGMLGLDVFGVVYQVWIPRQVC